MITHILTHREPGPGRLWNWKAFIRADDETITYAIVSGTILYNTQHNAIKAAKEILGIFQHRITEK